MHVEDDANLSISAKGLQGGERTRAVNKQGGGVTDFYFDVETKRVYSNAVI